MRKSNSTRYVCSRLADDALDRGRTVLSTFIVVNNYTC